MKYSLLVILLIGATFIGNRYRDVIDSRFSWLKPYVLIIMIVMIFTTFWQIFSS